MQIISSLKLFAPIGASVRTKSGRAPTRCFWPAPDQPQPQGNLSSARTGNGTRRRRMSDEAGASGAITLGGETKTPDLLVEGNAELFVRNTDGSEEAPPPALPAGPRPVNEDARQTKRRSRYWTWPLLRITFVQPTELLLIH